MSSNNKQQKRAKRAAAKAKKNRMVRNGTVAPKTEIDLDGPDVRDLIRVAIESGHYQNLFEQMKEAEKTSLTDMFSVFFRDPFTKVAQTTYADEFSYYVQSVLFAYHHRFNDGTGAEAKAWFLSEEVQDAFTDSAEMARVQDEQDEKLSNGP